MQWRAIHTFSYGAGGACRAQALGPVYRCVCLFFFLSTIPEKNGNRLIDFSEYTLFPIMALTIAINKLEVRLAVHLAMSIENYGF